MFDVICDSSKTAFPIVFLGKTINIYTVIDEFLCMLAGCALGTDVCHWMFEKRSTWFKVSKMAIYSKLRFYFNQCSR